MNNNNEIILHAFLWRYNDIRENLQQIKNQGFTSIQLTACQGIKGNGNEYWRYYQPCDIKFVDNPLGTKEELKRLCDDANKLGIKVVMDIVLRHCASDDYGNSIPHQDVNRDLLQYIKEVPNCDDYNDRWKYTHYRTGAMPMFDFENKEYQQICINFLNELKDIGIKGFRLDQLKHFPVEAEGSMFLKNVFEPFKDMYLYGEIIDCDTHINDLYVPYMKVCGNRITSDESQSVVFYDSHDIYYTWCRSKNMPKDVQIREWKWLFERYPKSDKLYFPHPFEDTWKSDEIRNINNTYKLKIK